MQRNSHPLPWRGRGLSDTLDASSAFNGAMQSLQNLIPHPSTKAAWWCRPAAIRDIDLTTFGPWSSGFSAAFGPPTVTGPIGAISLFRVIGNYAYMMVATGLNPGHDQPIVINLATGTYINVSGITAGNTPVSPPATGPWTPPTGALIGSKFIVTHPGFSGTGTNFVGVLDVTNPAAPAWSTAGTSGAVTPWTLPPSGVAQFNGRAYYIYNLPAQPAVYFSDALVPTTFTNANQILTFGDTVPLTCFGSLGLKTQLGGIIQALMVFKQVQNIYQITGDPTTNDLSVDALNITTGTLAANSVVNTPKGLTFMSPDGLRNIDFYATVSDPIGLDGTGVTLPFIFCVVPSRAAAACGGNVMRITVQNGNVPGSPNQEYWYDVARQIWSGPHTFPYSLIQPYNNTFIGQAISVPGVLWRSDVVQVLTSTFVENGQGLGWVWATPLLPDADQITNNCITESSIDMAFSAQASRANVAFLNDQGAVVDSTQIGVPGLIPTIWGQFVWGSGAVWGGQQQALSPYPIPWAIPIVFARGSFQVSGVSGSNLIVGALHMRYQVLRILVNQGAAA